ncbi:sodium:solute symporter family protein [Oceanibaculum sp.]|uniref:sodium:solute symporter family protein n=1 Tax=Oceanibaculum sp. TaxID=1903597 RepID=UPI002590D6ED|nr:sodium:solute symporter family protein [Oceanibaculum sp.]MCH2394945.1 cation acetate symporter [Oceanibaculum sp.]
MKGDFISNLGRIYGVYTGGFLGFVILLAILEQLGVPNKIIGYLFVFFTIAVYAGIGILSRTMQVSEYYVAGRRVPPLYNGMATAADWMSAASFIAMAGGLYARGYDGLAFVLGWTGGYVLVAVLIAPYLRKFGAYTVPDFLGARFGGNFARSIGILVLFACSFTYIVGQVVGVGTIASRFLGISFEIAVFVGLIGILVCSMMGGMRAVTWTQVAQYIVLIIAYLVPVVILSAQTTGIPIPQLMYGEIIQRITELEQTKPALAGATAHVIPFSSFDPLNFFALILCLMVGTASLPHVLMRFFTTPSVRDARKSVGWSLLFIFLLYFTAPAYAAFAKYEIFTNVIGATIAELPNWVKIYSDIGLVTIADANKDGILQFAELKINPDVIVIATPEIAGLPYVIAGLVAAGGLAAALSTADGLLLAIANALSHDIYYRMIDPQASTAKRLVVARILLVVVAILAAAVASTRPGGILALVAWAFSLAAAGLFPVLVLGVWWKRCTKEGAIAGMLIGFGFTLFYLVATKYFNMPLWFGVSNISAGLFGIPTGFLATIIVSMMTPPPSREMQDFIDSIRIPRGQTLMEEKA